MSAGKGQNAGESLEGCGGEVGALSEEVCRNCEGIAVDFSSGGVLICVLGGCAKSEHDPGKFLFPLLRRTS